MAEAAAPQQAPCTNCAAIGRLCWRHDPEREAPHNRRTCALAAVEIQLEQALRDLDAGHTEIARAQVEHALADCRLGFEEVRRG